VIFSCFLVFHGWEVIKNEALIETDHQNDGAANMIRTVARKVEEINTGTVSGKIARV